MYSDSGQCVVKHEYLMDLGGIKQHAWMVPPSLSLRLLAHESCFLLGRIQMCSVCLGGLNRCMLRKLL